MVRTYKRLSHKQEWDPGAMQQAIDACENGLMGYGKASKEFHVPGLTLRDRIKKRTSSELEVVKVLLVGSSQSFHPTNKMSSADIFLIWKKCCWDCQGMI